MDGDKKSFVNETSNSLVCTKLTMGFCTHERSQRKGCEYSKLMQCLESPDQSS